MPATSALTADIEVFTQSSIRIRTKQPSGASLTIYADTFQMSEAPHDADLILITHDHYDHYSPEDIAKVAKTDAPTPTIVVVPERMAADVQRELGPACAVPAVAPHRHYEIGGLAFDTVPSYNINKRFHPREAGWVGYVLDLCGRTVYISGDTDATPEARAVRCDVALVPIGGTYTMTPREAADLINEMAPQVAIPTHYGSIVGRREDAQTFAAAVQPAIAVEVKIP